MLSAPLRAIGSLTILRVGSMQQDTEANTTMVAPYAIPTTGVYQDFL